MEVRHGFHYIRPELSCRIETVEPTFYEKSTAIIGQMFRIALLIGLVGLAAYSAYLHPRAFAAGFVGGFVGASLVHH